MASKEVLTQPTLIIDAQADESMRAAADALTYDLSNDPAQVEAAVRLLRFGADAVRAFTDYYDLYPGGTDVVRHTATFLRTRADIETTFDAESEAAAQAVVTPPKGPDAERIKEANRRQRLLVFAARMAAWRIAQQTATETAA